MRHIEITIPIGLGDLIYIKSAFEAIKDQFSQIKIRFGRHIINDVGRNVEYNKFLDDIGQLFFSEMPYTLDDGAYPFCAHQSIYDNYGITPQKPELAHLLCKGNSLNLDSEYIVITTKLRYFPRQTFDIRADELWSTLKSLTTKYKIVVLGEQEVDMNKEYVFHTSQHIY
ncbi:MAG TPA: hypothetical protein VMR76_01475, partial [Candidatus Saccharimonadia bacterium]|nr:hypothetical protein [Candidatus Saccharimonadia bacterium]